MSRLGSLPEASFALFGFLVNYPWEFLQSPFFTGMTTMPNLVGVAMCTKAAFVDAALLVASFWIVGIFTRNRRWWLLGTRSRSLAFTGIALVAALLLERIGVAQRDWVYSDLMPVIPVLGVGLVPVLQWTVLPPLVLGLVRRHLSDPVR